MAGVAAFVVRWGLFEGVFTAAAKAELGYRVTVVEAWATVVLMAVVAYVAAAGVWWLIYRRLARPGRLWARTPQPHR